MPVDCARQGEGRKGAEATGPLPTLSKLPRIRRASGIGRTTLEGMLRTAAGLR